MLYFPHDAGPDYPKGWYYARDGVQADFASLLSAHNVTIVMANYDYGSHRGDVKPVDNPALAIAPTPPFPWLLAGMLVILLLLGARWAVRQLWVGADRLKEL